MEVMGDMAGAAGERQAKSIEVLKKDFEAILDSQNEIIKAVASIYQLQVNIAVKVGAVVPKPLVSMEVESS